MTQAAEVTTTATYLNMDVIVFNQDTAKGTAQILPVTLQTEVHMTVTVNITELTNFKIDGVPVEEMTKEDRYELMQNKHRAQGIVMGYSTTTGEPITLREHDATFAEYIGHDRAAAWRKTDQVGFYRALQEDWEAARDDDIDPPVVDTVADLEPYTIRIAQYRASKI